MTHEPRFLRNEIVKIENVAERLNREQKREFFFKLYNAKHYRKESTLAE